MGFELQQMVRDKRLDRDGSHTGRVVDIDSSRGQTVYEVQFRPRTVGRHYLESELEAVPDVGGGS